MRQNYLMLLFAMVVFSLLFFFYSGRTVTAKIKEIKKYDNAIKKEQEKLNSAKVLNEQLKDVSKVILNSISKKHAFNTDEVNAYIKRLGDLADKYKNPVYVQTPRSISSNDKHLVEQGYSMEFMCTYVQLGKFLSDLESFDNISLVKTLQVNPVKQDKNNENISNETRYRVNLELSVYKIIKES